MSDILLDSGILILHLRNQSGYPALMDRLLDESDVYISAMTRLEIVHGMRDHERERTFGLFNSLETLAVTGEIADRAGELISDWKADGVTLGIADALIAATAIEHNLALLTTNPKHFPMPELLLFQADEAGKMTQWQR
jgi:predicted nucleic acid-binding protein